MADYVGHCVVCHNNLITEEVIGGQVRKRFVPKFETTQVILSDGSKMRVCICSDCKETTDLSNSQTKTSIMNFIKNGWNEESGRNEDNNLTIQGVV